MSSPIILSHPPAFGFETARCRYNFEYQNRNKFTCLAYIPLVSMLVGVIRISGAYENAKTLGSKVQHIIRGTIEFLNLGVLLLIPDLILTAYRHYLKSSIDSKFAKPPALKPITIGSAEHPLSEQEIIKALGAKQRENVSNPVDTLIIYANNCNFLTDPGFIPLKPNKVILVGGNVTYDINHSGKESLTDELQKGWRVYYDRTIAEAQSEKRAVYHYSKNGELAQCLYIIPAQTPETDAL